MLIIFVKFVFLFFVFDSKIKRFFYQHVNSKENKLKFADYLNSNRHIINENSTGFIKVKYNSLLKKVKSVKLKIKTI